MAEDSREKLESESKDLTARYEKLLAENKSSKADMGTLENGSMKKLVECEDAYGKQGMVIAGYLHPFDAMSKELKTAKTDRDFTKKKAAFQQDLGAADKEMRKSPKLLDEWEAQIKSCKNSTTDSQKRATALLGLFQKVSEEAGKLIARIKTFNDSWTVLDTSIYSNAIPPVSILTPDLEGDLITLKNILKTVEEHQSATQESRKELTASEKDLKETTAKLEKLKFGAKAVKK